MASVRYLSKCANCGEEIESDHYDLRGWEHIDTGQVACAIEDPDIDGDTWKNVATPTEVEDDWDDDPAYDRWEDH